MPIPRGPTGSGMSLAVNQAGAAAAANIGKLDIQVKKLTAAYQPALTGLNSLATAGKIAAASLTGLVYFGARGTAELNRLTYELQRAGRELANSFAPAIRKLTDGIASLADFFHGMTGPQQAFVRNLTLGVVAAGGVATVFLKVSSAVTAFQVALNSARLQAALGGVGLSGAGGLAAAGVVGLLAATKEGREALAELAEVAKPLLMAMAHLASVVGQVLVPISQGLATALGWVTGMVRFFGDALEKVGIRIGPEVGGAIAGYFLGGPFGALVGSAVASGLSNGIAQHFKGIRGGAEAAARSPEGKSALTLATAGGAEDPRAILQRLQVASNKADYQRQTAENTEKLIGVIEGLKRLLEAQERPRKEVAQ